MTVEIKKRENQVQLISEKFNFVPRSFEEALKFADFLSKSELVPKEYQRKPSNIVVAIQMGAEVGLSPLNALNGIKIINGKPTLYGDSALAVVKKHPEYENHEEFEKDGVGVCRIKRKGHEWHECRFDIEKAKKAGLWGKPGPWTQYPDIMLQKRARGFALRNMFPDALTGLITSEEYQDYPASERQEYEMKEVEDMHEIEDAEYMKKENIIALIDLAEDACGFFTDTLEYTEFKEKVCHSMAARLLPDQSTPNDFAGFPNDCFEALKVALEKKIQQNKEKAKDINLEILNAGASEPSYGYQILS